jgi:hypothetical protein
MLRFEVLGTPLGVRRLYRNTLNFCQEIRGRPSHGERQAMGTG